MPKIRLIASIVCAKLLRLLIKTLGRSGATAAPGLIAMAIDPNLIKKMASEFEFGSIIISGTNGKTTTARILADICEKYGLKVIHNRAGSNLERGIASLLINKSSLLAKINVQAAIFEVDEAILPQILTQITPRVLILTNLFRDQLDRYGEINTIAKKWKNAILKLPAESTLVLNSDDPVVAHLGHDLTCKVEYFGIEDKRQDAGSLSRFADSKYCSFCTTPLDYDIVYISHLGLYSCPNCKNTRPVPTVFATDINFLGLNGSICTINLGKNSIDNFKLGIPGLYNIYNALAATAASYVLKIPINLIRQGLEDFQAVFGRVEKIKIDNSEAVMFLVKNPTGFNEVLRTLFLDNTKKQLLIAVNDLIADGRDISWLWDVDFERIALLTEKLTATGYRAYDLGLRLKYAGLDEFKVEVDLNAAIAQAFINLQPGQTLYVLPTYTAMLELRKKFARISETGHFWED